MCAFSTILNLKGIMTKINIFLNKKQNFNKNRTELKMKNPTKLEMTGQTHHKTNHKTNFALNFF